MRLSRSTSRTSLARAWRSARTSRVARFGVIGRRIREVGSDSMRSDLCRLRLVNVRSHGADRVHITSWAEIPGARRGFARRAVEARHTVVFVINEDLSEIIGRFPVPSPRDE